MPIAATDVKQKTAESLSTILVALTGLTAIGAIVLPRSDLTDQALTPTTPVVAYWLFEDDQVGGIGDERKVSFEIDCIAEGNNANAIANAMASIVRDGLTWSAFNALGMDACVDPMTPLRQVSAERADDTVHPGLCIEQLQGRIWGTVS
jgi:hypothetical protein